jgi:uncharacterized protein YjbI with pentapeptide repeats
MEVAVDLGDEEDLTNANLQGARIEYIDWSEMSVAGANLSNALIKHANLRSTDFNGPENDAPSLLQGTILRYSYWDSQTQWPAGFDPCTVRHLYFLGTAAEVFARCEDQERRERLNAWHRHANLVGANLSGSDLRGRDLSQADLRGANLAGTDLRDTNLADASFGRLCDPPNDLRCEETEEGTEDCLNLCGALYNDGTTWPEGFNPADAVLAEIGPDADLSRADLTGISLYGASLANANLTDVFAPQVSFRTADLAGADLSGAYLEGADLRSTNLSLANLSRANLHGTSLVRANLSQADFDGARFNKDTSLRRANIAGTDFSEVHDLGTADFGRAYGDEYTRWPRGRVPRFPPRESPYLLEQDSVHPGAQLQLANLIYREADGLVIQFGDMDRLYAWNSRLAACDFRGSRIRGAYLWASDFRGCDFSNTDLRWTSFSGSDLSGVNFQGADLRGAFLSSSLDGADFTGAICPNGQPAGPDGCAPEPCFGCVYQCDDNSPAICDRPECADHPDCEETICDDGLFGAWDAWTPTSGISFDLDWGDFLADRDDPACLVDPVVLTLLELPPERTCSRTSEEDSNENRRSGCQDLTCIERRPENCLYEACFNGISDDADGLVDCEDTEDCAQRCLGRCESPLTLEIGENTGSLFLATDQLQGTGECNVDSAEHVWRVSVPMDPLQPGLSPGLYTVRTIGAVGFDSVLSVRDGDCNGQQIACNDDDPGRGLWSSVEFRIGPGQSKYVVVEGYGGDRSDYVLELIQEEDPCEAPMVQMGDNEGNTQDAEPLYSGECAPTDDAPEDIWQFVPMEDGPHCVLVTAEFDSVLYVRGGTCDEGEEIACNDDFGDRRHSRLELNVELGIPYYVFVDGYFRNSGAYTLSIVAGACDQ